jgi:hypothetical protein
MNGIFRTMAVVAIMTALGVTPALAQESDRSEPAARREHGCASGCKCKSHQVDEDARARAEAPSSEKDEARRAFLEQVWSAP